jgi:hypothetical protein
MCTQTAVATCALLALLIAAPAAFGQGKPAAGGGESAERAVKLLDAGKGPKRELRYALKPGMADTLMMEIETAVTVTIGGRKVRAAGRPMMRVTLRAA